MGTLNKHERAGAGLAAGSVLLVGGSVAASSLLAGYPVLGGQAVRYLAAGLLLAAWTRLQRKPLPRPAGREWAWLAALAAIGLAGCSVMMIQATQVANPASVGVIIGAAPLVIIIAAAVTARRRPTRQVLMAAAVVTAGSAAAQLGGATGPTWSPAGLLWSAGALGGVVGSSLLAAPLLPRLGALAVTVYACGLAGILLLAAAAVVHGAGGPPILRTPTATQLASLAYLTIAITALVFIAWYGAMERLGVDRTGLFNGLIPVTSLAAVTLTGTGTITPLRLLGALAVLVGVILGLSRARQVPASTVNPANHSAQPSAEPTPHPLVRARSRLSAGQFVEFVEQLREGVPGDYLLAVRLGDDGLPPAPPGSDHHGGVRLTEAGQADDLFEFVGHQAPRRARMAVHRNHLPGRADRARVHPCAAGCSSSIPERVSHGEMYSHREMADRYGPVSMPDREWRKPEIRHALCERAVGTLLSLVQKHAGVSQARLATATGIGQGRLNEIINGHRQVARLDVLERIAGGLAMPDDARVLFGLAPVHADTLTGHAEISRVFTVQAQANAELREQAAAAARVDVLAVRALGLIALNDSLLRGPLAARETAVDVRVLLLDPDKPAAAIRAAEIGDSPDSFGAGIRLALARLAEFADHPFVRMRIALYDALPTWRMLVFDGTLYLSAFAPSAEGHRSGMYKLTAAGDGVLHAGFLRQFDDMWRQGRREDGR